MTAAASGTMPRATARLFPEGPYGFAVVYPFGFYFAVGAENFLFAIFDEFGKLLFTFGAFIIE